MTDRAKESRQNWDRSFENQIAGGSYNTAPVEALARNVSHYLRARHPSGDYSGLKFLETGCGGGINLIWLAQKGIRVSGIDISPTALALAQRNLEKAGLKDSIDKLVEGSVAELPFEDASMDGIVEACVFQHVDRENRAKAFAEVGRVLKPGGVFVGYMLSDAHTNFRMRKGTPLAGDPGTFVLEDKSKSASVTLETLGLTHFFNREEYFQHFQGFSSVDPLISDYELPREEARRRGFESYYQGMWTVYAVK